MKSDGWICLTLFFSDMPDEEEEPLDQPAENE